MTSNMENYFSSVAREEKREWQSVWRISLLSLDNMKLNVNQHGELQLEDNYISNTGQDKK